MKNTPYITIVTTFLNSEKFMRTAIDSALAQTFTDFELLLIDGGSDDRSLEIAYEYANRDSRVNVYSKPGMWIYDAYNFGTDEANGKYIFVLNSDDSMPLNALERMSYYAKKYDADIVYFQVEVLESDILQNVLSKRLCFNYDLLERERVWDTADKYCEAWPLLEKSEIINGNTSLYRTELLRKIPYGNKFYCEDTILQRKLAKYVNCAVYCPEVLYYFYLYINAPEMNTSKDKFYEYENAMLQELYESDIEAYSYFGQYDDARRNEMLSIRFGQYTDAIKRFSHPGCHFTYEQKLINALKYACEIRKFAVDTGRTEELESRALYACRNLIYENIMSTDMQDAGCMKFLEDGIESLLRYEKDRRDMKNILDMVSDFHNPGQIGKHFYEILVNASDNEPEALRVILFGAGSILQHMITTIDRYKYNILAIMDNDDKLWKDTYEGIDIIAPFNISNIDYDVVVICAGGNATNEIRDQLMRSGVPFDKIHEYTFFMREALRERYRDSKDGEIIEIVDYLGHNELNIFNYGFTKKYAKAQIEVEFDGECGMYYVMRGNHRIYMRKDFSQERVKEYYRSILMEQDEASPHRYVTDSFNVRAGEVVIDAGVAEGFFSMDIIDIASRIYLVECDDMWIEALKQTFKKYSDKVTIVPCFLSDNNENGNITIDQIAGGNAGFIKMDIEGAEVTALNGAKKNLLKKGLRMDICTYHNEEDYERICEMLDMHKLYYDTSRGYMCFYSKLSDGSIDFRVRPHKLVKALVRVGK